MNDFSERIAKLSPQKRALLELQLNKQRLQAPNSSTIPRRQGSDAPPLSYMQERIWLHHELNPDDSNNVVCAYKLSGLLQVDALRRALEAVVARHEVLRTTFAVVDGTPVQVIHPQLPVPLRWIDWADRSAPERAVEVERQINQEANLKFDLTKDCMLRGALLREADDEHVLILTTHHIAYDGWSVPILIHELSELYSAFVAARSSPLPELPLQYADYAVWHRQWLEGEELNRLLAYWKGQMAGSTEVLELPTDYPRPSVHSQRGRSLNVGLPEELVASLKNLSRQEGLTLFMTLLAAFEVLLYRYTQQDDISVGSFVANRGRPEIELLIGFFVNTVVLRTRLSDDLTVRELLKRVRGVTLGAFAHQELPLEKLLEELKPKRRQDRTPLFQVAINYRKIPASSFGPSGLTLTPIKRSLTVSYFDLALEIGERTDGLTLTFVYATDLFQVETVRRLGRHLQNLLEGMVSDPGQLIAELPLCSAADHRQLLTEWNQTVTDYSRNLCLHHFFEAQARETPEAVAVAFEEAKLSYTELNRQANQLANRLRRLGVGPEVIVGLCLERCPEMIIGVLGVLKAGGAYLPLDPAYPADRLAFMLADARPPVVLTQRRLIQGLPEHGGTVLCLDEWDELANEPAHDPVSPVALENIAYVIYTSGSTGRPKGVLIPHRAVVNHTLSAVKAYALTSADQVLQFASLSFDASAEEIFPCLARGATLRLRNEAMLDTAATFLQRCAEWRVTVLDLPTAYWHELTHQVEADRLELPETLRLVILGGERALPDRVETWRKLTGDRVQLVNTYGPTEATIVATRWELEPGTSLIPGVEIPIGRPVANAQVCILDRALQPVPVGVAGELLIGGVGLARGYLNRPELTVEKFVPNPFPELPTQVLYRTGDRARFRSDGNIEFLGRVDDQVKIRGFRVELGEIEAELRQHPAVRETVVVLREDTPGEKRLVSYVVGPPPHPSPGELRDFLKKRLPDYMLPSVVVPLDALPLTPNGKVDRRALPVPPEDRPGVRESYVAPRNDAEELLARIWSEVLRLKRVGIQDNFFELGGDSIRGIQIIARAAKSGLQLKLQQLIQYQTIAELAAVVEVGTASVAEQGLVTGPTPLTPVQWWFFEQEFAAPHHWNMPRLLEARPRLDRELLERTVRHLVRHHDALRLRFKREESGWEQVIAGLDEDVVGVSWQDWSGVPIEERASVLRNAAAEIQASLDLTHGPLMRVVFFDFGPDAGGRLLLAAHHLAVDGVSWRILLADLPAVYEKLRRGEAVRLPPKTTSFKAWAERLLQHAQTSVVQQELDYWLRLTGVQAAPLPVDFPGGIEQNLVVSHRVITSGFSAEETRSLLELPAAYRTQINDVLLTVLARALCRWSGAGGWLVDVEGDGREEGGKDVDLSRTVGWFTTIFPVFLDLEGEADGSAALNRVKEMVREIPNRGIGYGLLRYLAPEAIRQQVRRLPQAQIAFNYLGQFDQVFGGEAWLKPAVEWAGWERSPQGRRSHLLEISSCVSEGQLQVRWGYSEKVHRRETIEQLAGCFESELRGMLGGARASSERNVSPGDFPLLKVDRGKLDLVMAELKKAGQQRWDRSSEHIEDMYPLSPMQQGMLFHSVYDAGLQVYFVRSVHTLKGKLRPVEFKQAWEGVVQRHPIFRTAFVWEGLDEPIQVVFREARLPFEELDWSDTGVVEREARLEAFLKADRERGFPLAEPPLIRLALIRLSPDEYRLVWSCHHILVDGWTGVMLREEVFAHYEALCQGREFRPVQRRPYRDYIAWLQQQNLAEAEIFWRGTLKGFTAPTPLGVDRQAGQGPVGEEAYDEQEARLSAAVTARLHSLARQHRLTVNTILQGAWAILLSRYSGESDVLFGATVSGRPPALEDVEAMMGVFMNTLPVRVQVDPNELLVPWLQRLQERQFNVRQYEYAPLARIQGWSEVARGRGLFDSILVSESYRDIAVAQQAPGGLDLRLNRSLERTNYPLTVVLTPGAEFRLKLIYECERFEVETIRRMLGHFQMLLGGIASDPNQSIAALPLLEADERRRLLEEWNQTAADYPAEQTLPELFEAQVETTPNAIAVVFEGQELTYRELNARANQVAHYLRSLGVGPEVCVAICLERSLELIVGLLGILKAGGAYVPLDPAYPQERLAFMLSDARTPGLLTQRNLLGVIPAAGVRRVCLDADWDQIKGHSPENPNNTIVPENLAYVMYTSGSTGQPKGVSVNHRGVVRLVKETDYARFAPDEVFLQLAPISFDASTFEIWGALLNGARLVIFPPGVPSLDEIGQALARDQITTLWLTSALFQQMVERNVVDLRPLRQLLAGGDVLSVSHVQTVLRELPHCQLINGYGPTENTTFTCCCRLNPGELLRGSVPIGRPIANTRVFLLDGSLEPVPIGVYGEIYTSGDGLARGYLQRPELTAERFIPNPFGQVPGERFYKTGDIARFLADGRIEFLGRKDQQVKIRGFRIELGEIEAVLAQHPAVRENVVVGREEVPGNKRLVAYLVPRPERTLTIQEVRDHLKTRLPDYMVPTAFVLLQALPLTPSGKVDRRALPALPEGRPEVEDRYVAPHNATEELLVGIWSEVLRVKQVGIHDNFFELGGHSLLATQVVSRIRDHFGVELRLRILFERPTVASLSEMVDQQGRSQSGSAVSRSDAIRPALRADAIENLSDAEVKAMLLQLARDEPGRTR
jgi:amino acid adenylation domain-containing protein/non-ribosomal peptide synthase protein (TIGR01720 family)